MTRYGNNAEEETDETSEVTDKEAIEYLEKVTDNFIILFTMVGHRTVIRDKFAIIALSLKVELEDEMVSVHLTDMKPRFGIGNSARNW